MLMSNKWSDLFGSEWNYVCRLGSCLHDPEAKRAFWETVKAKKLGNKNYSIYDDYPMSENATRRAMHDCCEFVRRLRKPKEEESA